MHTYNQDEKESTREVFWEHTINSLTISRNQNTILTPDLANEFTLFVANKLKEYFSDDFVLNQISNNQVWLDYHQSVYGNRTPKELKVAYFCGPEPINDLRHLLARGIQPENIWAFELGKADYGSAKKQIIEFGAYINLFEGNISDFSNTYPQKFDIVYLDFTNHLLSKKQNPSLIVNTLFQSDFLSEISCLIVNTCYPDKTPENIDFLRMYHQNRKWLHRTIHGETEGSRFQESFEVHGIFEDKDVFNKIDKKFIEAYSNYSSAFPDLFSNVLHPIIRVLRLPTLRKKLFNSDNLNNALSRLSRTDFSNFGDEKGGFDLIMSATNYADWHFVDRLIKNSVTPFSHYLNNTIPGTNFTPFDAIKLYSLIGSIEEGYFDAFSNELLDVVKKMHVNTIEQKYQMQGVFCDMPMWHLWYSLIIGKYGHPYHINYKNHKRLDYTAKERTMCLDVFTFDKCRSLYDWLPSFEFMPEMFSNIHAQLIIRSYMDSIYKTQFYYNDTIFSWGHLLASGDTKNAWITEISDRITIK